ncbi:DUF6587 family protein [Pseudoduganella namucuonensis]|uniref:FeoB-associated Cys-rich membrane protein n=1 Tax=Pseudoduganella namucuonensis TaxID=1035707 RepID=A0A1I7LAB6_9BURK|nr:DUF6587 family protein [Pseudoduganella namucuonensis]SFV06702.1 hypothetical protein SAMN05216552_102599 [Pseudoduganella namucuonensis]
MWQQIIVGVIVAAALLHACTKYLPAAWRRRVVHALSRRGFDQDKLAKLFKTQSSCGDGCGSCGSCDTPAPPSPPDIPGARRVIKLHVQR